MLATGPLGKSRPVFAGTVWEETMAMSEFLPKLLEQAIALPAARPLLPRLPEARQGASGGRGGSRPAAGRRSVRPRSCRRGRRRRAGVSLGGELQVHDRFGTSTVRLDGFTYDIARTRRETYAEPGALPDVAPAPLAAGPTAAGFHGQRDRARPRRRHAPESWPRCRRRSRISTLAGCECSTTAASSTTRRACCGWCATRPGCGFEIEPHTRALADARDRRRCAAHASAGRGSAPSSGCSRASRTRSQALAGLRLLGLDTAIHPGFGLDDEELARRALALLPDDGRRDRLALAAAARGVPAPELAALLDSLRVRGRGSRRDRGRRHASRRGRERAWRRRARRRRSRPRSVGRRRSWWRWPARSAPRRQAREWLERAAPRPPDDRRPRPARRRRARRPRGRARAARGAGREARPAGVRARAGARRGAARRRRASVACRSMEAAHRREAARAVLRAGRARGDRPARRLRAVHDPARRILRRPVREPEPGPPDRRPPRRGASQPGSAPGAGRGQAGAHPAGPRNGRADGHGRGRRVRRAAARRGTSSCRRPTARRRGSRVWRRWC